MIFTGWHYAPSEQWFGGQRAIFLSQFQHSYHSVFPMKQRLQCCALQAVFNNRRFGADCLSHITWTSNSVMLDQARDPAWVTRGCEEFSQRGPHFLNYVQLFSTMRNTFFRGDKKFCKPPWSTPGYGPDGYYLYSSVCDTLLHNVFYEILFAVLKNSFSYRRSLIGSFKRDHRLVAWCLITSWHLHNFCLKILSYDHVQSIQHELISYSH